jgi:hypothetical protein
MPTHVGPNISGEENLVFGYDLKDQKNSYLGEPTTNQANTDYARTIQFHNQGSYNNAGTISDAPEKGTDWKKIVITNRGNNFRIAQFPYIIQTYGTTKVYSVEYDFGLTSGYFFYGDGSSGFGVLQDDGKRATARFTPPSSSDWYEALFLGNNTPASGINDTIYYRYYQVEEKSYPTRYTPTSRSSTQGLLDLTTNATINLSNISFDSNSQMTFDGTNDLISAGTHVSSQFGPTTTEFTIETLYKVPTTPIKNTAGSVLSRYRYNLNHVYNGNYIAFDYVNKGYDDSGSYSATAISSGLNPTGQWNHVVVTYSRIGDSAFVKIFLNGSLTNSTTSTRLSMYPLSNLYFGHSDHLGGTYYDFEGNIDVVKIYNRSLSSLEVLNNYNNIKRKYGI